MSKKKNKDSKNKATKKEEQATAEETLTTDNQEVTEEEQQEENELDQLRAQVDEQKDKYLRMYAEFENYKKRAVRDKIDLIANAARDTLSALLPVLDDFDRAQKNAESGEFSEGVQLIYNKFLNTMKARGLKEMESNGEVFDPEFHEAITEIPAPSDDMKGKIIDTVEKGYFLNEKIIRHAKVVVGK